MLVTYIERQFLDKYRCIDTERTFRARSSFSQGGLTYFRINQFDYKVVDTDKIINIRKDNEHVEN